MLEMWVELKWYWTQHIESTLCTTQLYLISSLNYKAIGKNTGVTDMGRTALHKSVKRFGPRGHGDQYPCSLPYWFYRRKYMQTHQTENQTKPWRIRLCIMWPVVPNQGGYSEIKIKPYCEWKRCSPNLLYCGIKNKTK